MKEVSYAGATFITTDRAADALMRFVAAMDRYGRGESIDIPMLGTAGDVETATLLVWAGAEIAALPTGPAGSDPDLDVSQLEAIADKRSTYKKAHPDNTSNDAAAATELDLT